MARARTRNHARDVTGALYFESGRFMQWLEGPASTITRLFGQIGHDRRHTDIEVLSYGQTARRVFADWDLRLYRGFGEPPPAGHDDVGAGASRIADDPEALRMIALALSRGRVGELTLALDQAGCEFRRQAQLCERLMRRYAELWTEDECSEPDVVGGLALAQARLRLHLARFPAHALANAGETVMVVPLPGARHLLGASLVQAGLEEAGYTVPPRLPASADEAQDLLSRALCDHVVLAGSGVFPELHRTGAVRRFADQLRRFLPPSGHVGLYGQLAAGADSATIAAWGCDHGSGAATRVARGFDPLDRSLH